MAAHGASNQQIADEIGRTRETVGNRLNAIYKELGIVSGPGGKARRQLVRHLATIRKGATK
jgi:DNA-binding NarL/FixJ family response regulator